MGYAKISTVCKEKGYGNHSIGGMQIKKIIARGYANCSKGMQRGTAGTQMKKVETPWFEAF